MAKGKSQKCTRALNQRWQSPSILPFNFCHLTFDFSACFLLSAFCLVPFARLFAQTPYAALDRGAVSYNGPGREVDRDLAGPEIRIGLLVPLAGLREAEGLELRRAAQMAIEEENAIPLSGGGRLKLAVRDESGPWGQVSTEIVHLVFDDDPVALITSAEGASAHLAEQVANKVGVPVLTLSSDTTTTEINLPWIFRLGPTDAAQARAFAHDIYRDRKLRRVLLVTQDDYDGRAGGDEFEKAVHELGMTAPTRITVAAEERGADFFLGSAAREDSISARRGSLSALSDARQAPRIDKTDRRDALSGAQAVVFWTDGPTAEWLVSLARQVNPSAPFYLCRKAVEGEWNAGLRDGNAPHPNGGIERGNANMWTAAAGAWPKRNATFEENFRRRFGSEPTLGAAEAYDAVRLLAASLRQSGPNRARLRDALAGASDFDGFSGVVSFDHAGNNTSAVGLLKLK